jgi:hypothetical protein
LHEAEIAGAIGAITLFAGHVRVLTPIGLAAGAFFLTDVALFINLRTVQARNILEARQRIRDAHAIAEQLAQKTFKPEGIEVSGITDGANVITIGGPGQRYRNDFIFGSNDTTTGLSKFFDSFGGLITSGPIVTHNSYDQNGELIFADSNIVIGNGASLFRFGRPLSSWLDNPDGSSTVQVQFTFSAELSPTENAPYGSFNQGLNGLATTGNVSLTTAPDGRRVIVESWG